MSYYKEVKVIRGNVTIDGILDYLNFLEARIDHKLKYNNEDTHFHFGESIDGDSGKFISHSLFSVPEWLQMGKDIEEWFVYSLSLEMTNFYINSKERMEKQEKRRTWLRSLNLGTDEKFIESNERDCLSLIRTKKQEMISYFRFHEDFCRDNGNKPIGDHLAEIITNNCNRIISEKNDELVEIAERKAKTELIINDMLNETIEHIKNNNLHWQELANELTQIVNQSDENYNIPYMKGLFEIAKMSEQERIARFGNPQTTNDNCIKRNSIPSEIKREVWRRDQGKCSKCGSRKNLEYDHIIPVSKGGSCTIRNIELLCQECNRKKQIKYCKEPNKSM